MQIKHFSPISTHPQDGDSKSDNEQRELILTHQEALAGSPDDMAACGEEDIGAGLEFLVTRHDHDKSES